MVEHLARLLAAHRRRIDTPKGSRALGPFRQAVLVLRWFRKRGCVHCLARDADVSQATGYRCLHEGIDVLADQATDLHEVLTHCPREGMTHEILDGTLIKSDRLAGVRQNGNDVWFSQKHKAFGGNIQFLSAPDGTPLWASARSVVTSAQLGGRERGPLPRRVPGTGRTGPEGSSSPPARTRSVAKANYLSVRVAKIYAGRSRHWIVVWLWFLS
ncbi:hypothetical protein ACFXPY_34185 [Streptomyces sp. NPDC059153]|uniref:hypothetical protein n=1 Tax=Streptomyces sp. NPDC059153 TaxID=3346743 RepID=UPI0036C1941C